jgi:L-amino acid N-acyltransferase YncA
MRFDMATLCHQVWIDAPIEKLYDAISTADGLGGWWAPHTSTQSEAGLVLAHGSVHRERSAYRWPTEVSGYVHPSFHRQGIGRALYLRLLDDLTHKGFCNAYAGVALPNDGSVALHRSVGFEFVDTFKAIGGKFGRWHDVAWFQRALRDSPSSE